MSKKLAKTLTATEARKRIFDLLDKISSDPSFQAVISHHGKPAAVLVNLKEWESLLETLSIASNPRLVKNLEKTRRDIKRGNVLTYDEVFGQPQPGFVIADKGKVVYKLTKAVERKEKTKR